VLKKKTPS
jgi:hypothetical protein